MIGVIPVLPPEEKESFDPLDNDYIEIKLFHRNTTKEAFEKAGGRPLALNSNSDYDFEICSDKAYSNLVVSNLRRAFPKALCFKHRDRVGFRGNFALESNYNKYLGVLACDPSKRSTCKSRKEIG